jgi:hypothetical protein
VVLAAADARHGSVEVVHVSGFPVVLAQTAGAHVAAAHSLRFPMPFQACSAGYGRPCSHTARMTGRTVKLAEGAGMTGCRLWEVARTTFFYSGATRPTDQLHRGDPSRGGARNSPWRRQWQREYRDRVYRVYRQTVGCGFDMQVDPLGQPWFGKRDLGGHLTVTCLLLPSQVHHHFFAITSGMRVRGLWCARRAIGHHVTVSRRLLSTQAPPQQSQISRTRNIGIVAHIDAVSMESGYYSIRTPDF